MWRLPSSARAVRAGLRVAVLPAAVLALELRSLPAAGVLGVLTLLWLAGRPARRAAWVGTVALLAPVVVLLGTSLLRSAPAPSDDRWVAEAAAAYAALWDDLESAAATAAAGIEIRPTDPASRLQVFEQLQALAAQPRFRGKALLLLDPDGEAAAWAGEGLLHELRFDHLRGHQAVFERSYTAVTLLAVEPLSNDSRPWRLVAGRSDLTDRLPFAAPSLGGTAVYRWSVGERGGEIPAEIRRIELPERPSLYLERRLLPRQETSVSAAVPFAPALLALGLLALALVDLPGRRRVQPQTPPTPVELAIMVFASGLAVGRAAALGWPESLVLAIAAGAAAAGLASELPPDRAPSPPLVRWLAAAGVLPLVAGVAWLFARGFGALDLGAELSGAPGVLVQRLSWVLGAVALLILVGRLQPVGERWRGRLPWLAALLLLATGVFQDIPLAALVLLALGGGCTAVWFGGFGARRRPTVVAVLVLLAALGAAAAWETAWRADLRQRLEHELLPQVAPPDPDELAALYRELEGFFEGLDLTTLIPPGPGEVDGQDLAFTLWRRSPLAQRDGLSALVVRSVEGEASSFSLGLPLDKNLDLVPDSSRWNVPAPSLWSEMRVLGESVLLRGGQTWGTVSYWFLPRPGFRLQVSEIEELEAALLRGQPSRRFVDGLPPSVLYALYSYEGEVLAGPWRGQPSFEEVSRAGRGVVDTPTGRSWFWAREGRDGLEVLFLPMLRGLAGLERQATHAVGALLLLAVLGALALPLSLPRTSLADGLRNTLRSYSKRLILVYTVLLFVPLVALSLVLMQGFEERLRQEQLAQGTRALESARVLLRDYIVGLASRPGFDIATEINRELLNWISTLVHHQVNLYWDSRVYASSQQELFTSGLLPRRIPGEIVARLALVGYEQRQRTQASGRLVYLELYAPLQLPGVPIAEERFILSVPLLEQEKEVVRELASMRRQTLLVTTGLFLLLLVVGSQLARGFTEPLMELVEGTRRIAAGARATGLAPRERELAALGAAIDEMAARIAEAREQLVRAERLEAWAEMARIIAHEIKNPLTPIRLSTEHLREVWRVQPERLGEVFDRCTGNILRQVEELREIATEFSIYSRIPRAELVPGDLVEAVRELVEGYRTGGEGVEIRLEAEPPVLAARFDRRLLGRAVRNLIENALRASAGGGAVEVSVALEGEQAVVRVADSGPGVAAENLPRIFEPYFSTHDTGTGLGLPIAKRVVEEHGGTVVARNRSGGGLEVVIKIPRALDEHEAGDEPIGGVVG